MGGGTAGRRTGGRLLTEGTVQDIVGIRIINDITGKIGIKCSNSLGRMSGQRRRYNPEAPSS